MDRMKVLEKEISEIQAKLEVLNREMAQLQQTPSGSPADASLDEMLASIKAQALKDVEMQSRLSGVNDAIAQLQGRRSQKQSEVAKLQDELKLQAMREDFADKRQKLAVEVETFNKLASESWQQLLKIKELVKEVNIPYRTLHGHSGTLLDFWVTKLPRIIETQGRFRLELSGSSLFDAELEEQRQKDIEEGQRHAAALRRISEESKAKREAQARQDRIDKLERLRKARLEDLKGYENQLAEYRNRRLETGQEEAAIDRLKQQLNEIDSELLELKGAPV